jgi:hypothetical protein
MDVMACMRGWQMIFALKNESLLRKRYEHERDYNPFFLTKEENQRLKY